MGDVQRLDVGNLAEARDLAVDGEVGSLIYEKCGFVKTHSIKNFFIDNYDHPIYECGVRLTDMIYLQRAI